MYSEFIISEKIVCIILYNEENDKVGEILRAGTLPSIAESTEFNKQMRLGALSEGLESQEVR